MLQVRLPSTVCCGRHISSLLVFLHEPRKIASKPVVVAALGATWVAILILWLDVSLGFCVPHSLLMSALYYTVMGLMGAAAAISAQLLLLEAGKLVPGSGNDIPTPTEAPSQGLISFEQNASTIGSPRIVEVIMTGEVSLSPLVHIPWSGVSVAEATHAYLARFRWPDPDPDHGLLLKIEEMQRKVLPGGVLSVRRRLHFSLAAVPWAARRFLGLDAAWADEEVLFNAKAGEASAHIVMDCIGHLGEYHCYSTIHATPPTQTPGGDPTRGGAVIKSRMQVRGHTNMARSFIGSLMPPSRLGEGLQKELATLRTAYAVWKVGGGASMQGVSRGLMTELS
jgi:hypothetical protein